MSDRQQDTAAQPDAQPQPSTAPQPSTTPQPDAQPLPDVTPQPSTAPQPDAQPLPDVTPQPSTAPQPDAQPQPNTPAQPVAGLGVDIVEIARMERALVRTPRIRERVFSQGERDYAKKKARPAIHYALFFAAKEAVLKALGTGFTGMRFTDVEVTHDKAGRPLPLLHGNAAEVAQQQGIIEMHLSLSYTHDVGVASAVAIKEQDRPRKPQATDPREELARQFKEVRALLDEMDGKLQELEEAPPTKEPPTPTPTPPAQPAPGDT